MNRQVLGMDAEMICHMDVLMLWIAYDHRQCTAYSMSVRA